MKLLLPLLLLLTASFSDPTPAPDARIFSYIVNPKVADVQIFGTDVYGLPYGSIGRLLDSVEARDKKLLFAMNGGMYTRDHQPVGLFVEKGQVKKPIDRTKEARGNFYMQPNGVFSLDKDGTPRITTTPRFKMRSSIEYATQSGPMLLIDGKMHPAFNEGSPNRLIRNGVGILRDGRLLFAMSKEPINFFDFASYFRAQGCKNALYLDGVVCQAYCPAQEWEQLEGDFAVIIGVVE